MNTEAITLQVDQEAARIFKSATVEEQEKVQVLLGIWLKELGTSEVRSLSETMDEISQKAQARGLTSELLEDILKED